MQLFEITLILLIIAIVFLQIARRGRIQDDAYHLLEDELDRAELHVAPMSGIGLDA